MVVRIIYSQLILFLVIRLTENANILGMILHPSYSHSYPLIVFYKELARNGHTITLLTSKLIEVINYSLTILSFEKSVFISWIKK